MSENPYAPPKSVVADPATVEGAPIAASTLLYSSGQVAVAAFLGAVPAAAWLIVLDAHERTGGAFHSWWRVIGIGLLGLLLVFGLISIGVLAQILIAGGERG